jgi:hypothetical protein
MPPTLNTFLGREGIISPDLKNFEKNLRNRKVACIFAADRFLN